MQTNLLNEFSGGLCKKQQNALDDQGFVLKKNIVVLCVLVSGWWCAGCAPVFLAAGAGGGYLLEREGAWDKVGKVFRGTEATTSTSSRKIQPEEGRSRNRAAAGQHELALKIEQNGLSARTVQAGSTMVIRLQYVLEGAASGGQELRERCSLSFQGHEVAVLKDDQVVRASGTWENTLTFVVPPDVEPGEYTLVQQVSGQGISQHVQRIFTVL